MSGLLAGLGIKIEIASWRNIVPNVWSLHIRDAHSPMCFTNGKGATKESALASALGEYIERISNNHFYAGASGARTSPTRRSSITRTSAGSSLAPTMRCRPGSSTSTAWHLRSGRRTARLASGRHQLRQCGARHRSLPYVRHSDGESCISRPT
jgi:ribosomal protein S12 methylthiotransferase accessory factor